MITGKRTGALLLLLHTYSPSIHIVDWPPRTTDNIASAAYVFVCVCVFVYEYAVAKMTEYA